MDIAERVQKIKASGIREIFEAKKKAKVIDFSIGQPDFDVAPKVKQAAIKAIQSGHNKYTENQGIPEARQAIADKLKSKNNIPAAGEEIIITAGVTGGLALTLTTLFNPGDEVIVPDPYFPLYTELPKLLGIKVIFLGTYPDFTINIDRLKEKITNKTKAIFVNSPNAPTGQVYSKQLLADLTEVAKEKNIIIISDEIYEDYIYDDNKHFSIGSIYPNTITLNGFTKSYGMPGWRIGYLHAPAQVIAEMVKVQQLLYCCAPSVAQYAAIQALKNNQAEKIKIDYQAKRDLVYSGLKDKFEIIKSAGTFYAFIKAPNQGGQEFCRLALQNGVALVPGSMFSEKDSHFRLAFCTSDQAIKQGVEKILSIVA